MYVALRCHDNLVSAVPYNEKLRTAHGIIFRMSPQRLFNVLI